MAPVARGTPHACGGQANHLIEYNWQATNGA